jgi:hypothetical protein
VCKSTAYTDYNSSLKIKFRRSPCSKFLKGAAFSIRKIPKDTIDRDYGDVVFLLGF